MHLLIDWLSFTIITDEYHFKQGNLFQRDVMARISKHLGYSIRKQILPDQPLQGPTHSPYTHGWRHPLTKTTVMAHPDLNHILIEMPGKACAHAESTGVLHELIAVIHERCTRIDLSADIRCNTSPEEFVAMRDHERFSTRGVWDSPTGITCYVGSPTSERKAAVYRYAEPHPRHEYLRVEHRFSGSRAKDVAKYVSTNGLLRIMHHCRKWFGWIHPDWNLDDIDVGPVERNGVEQADSKEVLWVLKQVIPALKRYESEGKIDDLRAFLEEHLFDSDG